MPVASDLLIGDVMVRLVPRYLLFTDTFVDQAESKGYWRFTLQEIDGPDSFEVIEKEPGVDSERLELLSVMRGLEALDQPTNVTIVTASRYVSRGFRFGLDQWRDNDWQWERFGEMRLINNCDLWQRVDRALKFHTAQCRCLNYQLSPNTSVYKRRTKAIDTAFSIQRFSRWSGRKIAKLADSTKSWALRLSNSELDVNQVEQNQFAS